MAGEMSPKKSEAAPTPTPEELATPAVEPTPEPAADPVQTPDEKLISELDDFVLTNLPPEKIVECMEAVRKESRVLMECIIVHSPDAPRRTEALRHVQEAMLDAMTAMLMPRKQFEKPKEKNA